MRRKGLRGGARVRRMLRALPEAMRAELLGVLDLGGRALRSTIRNRARKRTGFGAQGILYKVLPGTMKLRVGLIGTPNGRADRFYMRIQEKGRRAQIVQVQRRRRAEVDIGGGQRKAVLRSARGRKIAGDIQSSYPMRVPAMAPKYFIRGSYPNLRRTIGASLRGIWGRSLSKLSGGARE